jgi:hypothetical protein
MIQNGIGVFTALTLLSSAVAYAGSAPKELYGKSISLAWTESFTGKYATEQMTRSFGISYRMQVYAGIRKQTAYQIDKGFRWKHIELGSDLPQRAWPLFQPGQSCERRSGG